MTDPVDHDRPAGPRDGVTRRRALLGGGLLGLSVAGGGGFAAGQAVAADAPGPGSDVVPFHGTHQAGIATPAQDRLVLAGFDLVVESASGIRDLLREWTRAAGLLCAGRPAGDVAGAADAVPGDSGEASGLPAARLTITFGFGPAIFDRDGEDRFGLRDRRPAALRPLDELPGDEHLEAARGGGDLCVQACADDPVVAFHAVRTLTRLASGWATVRWTQHGFGRTSSTSRTQETPRNLMGFKDGTNNIRAEDRDAMDRFVWVGREEPQRWFRGGSYLVARRIQILLDDWDADLLTDQEAVIGRSKGSGAPLTGRDEFDEVDLRRVGKNGVTVIPPTAHVRLAAPSVNGGERLLRRGYSYADGTDARSGRIDAGLLFLAYQQDPHRQFAAIQSRLGRGDAMTRYLRHTASALFAVPPGVAPGRYVGQGLLEG